MSPELAQATTAEPYATENISPSNRQMLYEDRLAIQGLFSNFLLDNRQMDGTYGQLTSWQSDALRATQSFIYTESPDDLSRWGRYDIACGGGKSSIAIYLARAMGAGKIMPSGRRRQILLNTSRNGIVDQFTQSNAHYGDQHQSLGDFQYFAPELTVSVYDKQEKDMSGDVVIMPYQSLLRAQSRGDIYPGRFSAVLLDEAHNLGPKNTRVLKECAQDSIVIGLSATPGRSRHTLPKVIDKITAVDGIVKYKFLSSTRLFGIESGKTIQRRGHQPDFHGADIATLSTDADRNEMIIETARFCVQTLGPGWIRCHPKYKDVNHALSIAEMARDGDPIVDIFGRTRQMRIEPIGSFRRGSKDIIQEFKETDDIDALAYVRFIEEGYTIPKFRWGIWTPPTMSYDRLEQTLGRGNRLDETDEDKIFTFFQMIDTTPRLRDKAAFAWELFGLPRHINNGISITPDGISQADLSAKTSPSQAGQVIPLPDFLRRSIERRRKHPLHALDIAAEPLDTTKVVHSLDALWSATGLNRAWMRRVLFHGDFGATLTLDNGEPEFYYEEDALGFLLDAVAAPEDVLKDEAAEMLGVNEATFRRLVEEGKIDFCYLYTTEDHPWAVPLLHVRSKQLQNLIEYRGQRREIRPTEIGMAEVSDRTGLRQNHLGLYLEIRGFSMQRILVRNNSTREPVGNRAKIEQWIRDYLRAPLLPAKGFTKLSNLRKLKIDDATATFKEIFESAHVSGTKIWIFQYSNGIRGEFILDDRKYIVEQALVRLVKNRIITPQLPKKINIALINKLGSALCVSDGAIAHYANLLGIDLTVDDLDNTLYESIRTRVQRVRRSIAIVADEPLLLEAITGKPRSVTVHQTHANRTPNEQAEVIKVASRSFGKNRVERQADIHPRLLQLVHSRHSVLKQSPLQRNEQGDLAPDTKQTEVINAILHKSGIAVATIPLKWHYVGDIAAKIGVKEGELLSFIISKNIGASHVQYLEIAGTRGVIAFCSPELTDKITRTAR